MKNYYKIVYPSGDLRAISYYLTCMGMTLTFSGYTCYWVNESVQNGVKKRERVPGSIEEGNSLYVETRLGRNVMDVYISTNSSNQLEVECFYNGWTRFFIIFPPLILLLAVVLGSGGNPGEDLWPVLKALLIMLLALKLMVHLFFLRDKHKLMKDLENFLKEKPLRTVSSWKLRL